MVNLPQEFKERMQRQLGDEFELFLSCYEAEEYAGLRINTEKITVEEFLALTPFELIPVPWTTNGFYYRKEDAVTKHPHYFAGLYYVQEPSAMLPASRLPLKPGDVVLDLCAAPGGKATELSSRLGGEGLLVANDVSPSRAKALYKNLSVWGSKNCCITGETPQKLLQSFGCFFDRILVDAPCSGEGMFRKEASLIADWLERGPLYYAQLQKEILSAAVQMLRPGGMLVYSTCTFSAEEDEDVIVWILKQYPQLELVKPEWSDGFVSGRAPCENAVRIWPHKIKGEGHFLALLHKRDAQETKQASRSPEGHLAKADVLPERELSGDEVGKSRKQMPGEVRAFLELLPEKIWKNCRYQQIGEQCLLLPPYRVPGKLRYLLTGLVAGTWKKERFEPAQQLAMVLKREDFASVLDLSCEDPRVLRYLKGETVALLEAEDEMLLAAQKKWKKKDAKGWVLICVDGYGLGWGKYTNGMIKNKYYPGWRLQ